MKSARWVWSPLPEQSELIDHSSVVSSKTKWQTPMIQRFFGKYILAFLPTFGIQSNFVDGFEQIQSLLLLGIGNRRQFELQAIDADLARQVLTVMVSRCSIRVRKQYAAEPSSMRAVATFLRASAERIAGKTGSRVSVNSSRCGSANNSSRQASRMCHST